MHAAMGWGEEVRVLDCLENLVDGLALSIVGRVASQGRLKSGHESEPMMILRLGWPLQGLGQPRLIAGLFLAHWSL